MGTIDKRVPSAEGDATTRPDDKDIEPEAEEECCQWCGACHAQRTLRKLDVGPLHELEGQRWCVGCSSVLNSLIALVGRKLSSCTATAVRLTFEGASAGMEQLIRSEYDYWVARNAYVMAQMLDKKMRRSGR